MTATECYQRRQAAIATKLGQLQARIAQHAERQKTAPRNWGYAGDLARVEEQLQYLIDGLEDPTAMLKSARSTDRSVTRAALEAAEKRWDYLREHGTKEQRDAYKGTLQEAQRNDRASYEAERRTADRNA